MNEAIWGNPAAMRVVGHVALTAGVLGLLLLTGKLAVGQAKKRSAEWIADFLRELPEEPIFPEDSPVPPFCQTRLKAQFRDVRNRILHHTKVMAFFYGAYYMSILCFSLAAAMAAVAAVLVSKDGWQVANEYIVNLLFTSTLSSAFFGSSPAVFQQQKNISDNKVFAMKYLALKNEILTYAVTAESLKYDVRNPLPVTPAPAGATDQKPHMGITLTTSEFLHYVDLQLSRDNVAIGFDVKQVADFKGALEMK